MAGLALAALVSWRWSVARGEYAAAVARAAEAGDPALGLDSVGGGPGLAYPAVMLVGFGAAMLGLTMLAPAIVGLAGRLAGRLRLTGRLAVRDAARHRHRTGPAVGAVMVAVAGSVAVAFAVASYDQRDRDAYQPSLPAGWASAYLAGGLDPDQAELRDTARAAAVELPGGTLVEVASVYPRSRPPWERYVQWEPARAGDCAGLGGGQVGVGVPTARLIAGARADEAAAALAAGRAVVTEPCLVDNGTATLRIASGIGVRPPRRARPGPRHRPTSWSGCRRRCCRGSAATPCPRGCWTPPRPAGPGWSSCGGPAGDHHQPMPTAEEEDQARAALGPDGSLQVERGYGSPYLPGSSP